MLFNLSELRCIVVFFAIAVLTLNSPSSLSAQESEDSRTKEMRQMWQNIVKRRPRRQVKIARSEKLGSKASVNTQGRKVETKTAQTEPSVEEGPQPEYKIVSTTIPAEGQDIGI